MEAIPAELVKICIGCSVGSTTATTPLKIQFAMEVEQNTLPAKQCQSAPNHKPTSQSSLTSEITKSLHIPKDLIASFSSADISKPPKEKNTDVVEKSSVLSVRECTSACDAAKTVAAEYVSQTGKLESEEADGDGAEDGMTVNSSSTSGASPCSIQDMLALQVGHSAQEYLEECFHTTEISVLDREKFEDVPEIAKSDFTILGHLGKGSFSDVFEVVRKADSSPNKSRDAIEDAIAAASKRSSQFSSRLTSRGRRASLSASIASANLTEASRRGKHTTFALKCLRPQIRSDADLFTMGAEDLVHETAILASLDHPHIIKLHGRASGRLADAFILNDGYFILLDRLGETLCDRLRSWKKDPRGRLRRTTTAQIGVARDVADALTYLHSRGIAFRDLKPANVGFDPSGALKLFDFGFAAGLPERDDGNPSGLFFDRCGTPRYMAPEVGLGLGYGLAADVYSLGVLLWEVCALSKPFARIKTTEEFDARVFAGGERPEIDDRWPAAIVDLVRRCWSALPARRPTMLRVKSALRAAMSDAADEGGGSPADKAVRVRPGWARRRTIDGCREGGIR